MPAAAAVGPYRIEAEIGRGATSVVYRALDTRDGRRVALKTLALNREFDAEAIDAARSRFLREADAARRLHHPGVVAVQDAGEAGGTAYLAMEWVAGHDLRRHTAPGALLPLPQVLEIAASVADALGYAHSQGVVHRDVKAANVLIDAASGRVRVADFGVARIADASHTRTGMLLGTPECMAPELLAGQRADSRSDLYALGVLLFQLLCGRLPFEAAALGALMRQVVNDPAPPLQSLRGDAPAALSALVAQLLAKDPASRPPDGAAVGRELRTIAAVMQAPPGAETMPP
ncbi:MAG: serine/threonine protein kinase [Burkholderiaceae bacterium]|nr:serine/threonine protein kinase [Burkholderiaceae bacterium]